MQEFNDYPMPTQARIVPGCAVLHNFIKTYDPDDSLEALVSSDATQISSSGSLGAGGVGPTETQRATKKREQIAQDMWTSYMHEVQR